MKTTATVFILLCVLFNQSGVRSEDAENLEEKELFQADKTRLLTLVDSVDFKAFLAFADDIDRTWSTLNREYHARLMFEICRALVNGGFNEKQQYAIARKYALLALAKSDMIPLELELEFIGYVTTFTPTEFQSEDFPRRRKEDVEVRLHAWRRLIALIDPMWKPAEVPPMLNMAFGLDAEEMRTEKIKRVQNQKKSMFYDKQFKLHDLLKKHSKCAEDDIVRIYSVPPFNVKELKQTLDLYLIDGEIKARIVNAVEKNNGNEPVADDHIKKSMSR